MGNKIKSCCNKVKNFVDDYKYPLYAIFNSVGANIIDIPVMKSIPNDYWPQFISSGQYYGYLAAFGAVRFLPTIVYGVKYLKNRNDPEKALNNKEKFLNFFEIGLWTVPLEDATFYALQGRNPISPDPSRPYNYPFAWGYEHVAEYSGKNFAVAGVFTAIKRKFSKKK